MKIFISLDVWVFDGGEFCFHWSISEEFCCQKNILLENLFQLKYSFEYKGLFSEMNILPNTNKILHEKVRIKLFRTRWQSLNKS
jgi:hypothetical protein